MRATTNPLSLGAKAGLLMTLGFFNSACGPPPDRGAPEEAAWARERAGMVVVLRRYGIRDEAILAAMGKIRRHRFIPEPHRKPGLAYGDHPNPIGRDQTISQPFIVAYMTERLAPRPGEKVLEIGTGSGYQAAVLAELGARVFTVEIQAALATHALLALADEGYAERVTVRHGDGYRGWPEHAPYDAVIVTCAPEAVPAALVDQLREGGRLILPVGGWLSQRLVILRKREGRIEKTDDLPVRFVPMVHASPAP